MNNLGLSSVADILRVQSSTELAYMVNLVLVEQLVPAALIGVVPDHHQFEILLPFGMEAEDFLDQVLTANGANNGVARGSERIDDMGSHEGVGTGEKSQRHLDGRENIAQGSASVRCRLWVGLEG